MQEDGPQPRHVLAGYIVSPRTLLEVRLASTTSEPAGQEPDWLPVRYEVPNPVGPWATWLLAVDTPAGPRQLDLRLLFPRAVATVSVGAAFFPRRRPRRVWQPSAPVRPGRCRDDRLRQG